MAEAINNDVVSLHRVNFAGISLSGLSVGEWSELTAQERGRIAFGVKE